MGRMRTNTDTSNINVLVCLSLCALRLIDVSLYSMEPRAELSHVSCGSIVLSFLMMVMMAVD